MNAETGPDPNSTEVSEKTPVDFDGRWVRFIVKRIHFQPAVSFCNSQQWHKSLFVLEIMVHHSKDQFCISWSYLKWILSLQRCLFLMIHCLNTSNFLNVNWSFFASFFLRIKAEAGLLIILNTRLSSSNQKYFMVTTSFIKPHLIKLCVIAHFRLGKVEFHFC